ncbi:MAG: hypothetical protein HFI74_08790 [Lachnospiraceae bacterium]|jgi:hypothetical protein|nr:hypothetical protein [Lachnospiraceae bacterium]
MKRISLETLMSRHPDYVYTQQYDYVMCLLKKGKLKPVKSAGTNGRTPALCLSYWVQEEEDKSQKELEEELQFQLVPRISIAYYLSHLREYQKDRPWVRMLNEYLKSNLELLKHPESVNERSFEIWKREKFLTREQGAKILKRCGMEPIDLNTYETAEPLAYYSHTRQVPQNILILENKDTFFSMRRYLLDGNIKIFGIEIGTLIYGGGKRIVKSFQDFDSSAEPYMQSEKNNILYFGDLDYEGIGIYESLIQQCQGIRKPVPFQEAYERMLRKAASVKELPKTKEQQNRNLAGIFFSHFSSDIVVQMQKVLEKNQYIPQEILNLLDFG